MLNCHAEQLDLRVACIVSFLFHTLLHHRQASSVHPSELV